MSTRVAPLTDVDRRVLAHLDALYGPPTRTDPSTPERPGQAAPRPLGGSIVRTVGIVTLAVALVTSTESGRHMFEAIGDGVRAACLALLGG